MCNFLKRSNIL
jgi:hypothetical protein